jgi:hypothetical protein
VQISYSVDAGMNAGGWWDIDACVVQNVTVQKSNNQTTSMVPIVQAGSDYTLLKGANAAGSTAYYGVMRVSIQDPYANNVALFQDGNQVQLSLYRLRNGSSGAADMINFSCGATGPASQVGSGGVLHGGYTGPVAGRSCIAGIVV